MEYTNEDRMNFIKQYGNLLNYAQKLALVSKILKLDPSVVCDGNDCVDIWLNKCSEKIILEIYSVVRERYNFLNSSDRVDLSHLYTPDEVKPGFR
jgi:hypothetical protein